MSGGAPTAEDRLAELNKDDEAAPAGFITLAEEKKKQIRLLEADLKKTLPPNWERKMPPVGKKRLEFLNRKIVFLEGELGRTRKWAATPTGPKYYRDSTAGDSPSTLHAELLAKQYARERERESERERERAPERERERRRLRRRSRL